MIPKHFYIEIISLKSLNGVISEKLNQIWDNFGNQLDSNGYLLQ